MLLVIYMNAEYKFFIIFIFRWIYFINLECFVKYIFYKFVIHYILKIVTIYESKNDESLTI